MKHVQTARVPLVTQAGEGGVRPRFRSVTLKILWAPVAVVILHSILAGLIGHRRGLDPGFHFLGGVAGAFAFCQALVLIPRLTSRFAAVNARLLAVVAVAIVAVLWECAEFASDRLFGSHIQLDQWDTMVDLALGVGGAMIGAILGAASQRHWRPTNG